MKKYLNYFLIVAPVVLVAVAFVVKDTTALTDIDISPPSPDRSICSNAMTSYDPPSTKSTCRGAEASLYIACAGENDKICKTTVGPEQWDVYYGCTQFDNCGDLMGISNTEEVTNVGWFRFDGNAATKGHGPRLDGKCKKAFVILNPDPGGGFPKMLSDLPFASKQECESASTTSSPSRDDCTMDGWSCESWSACSAEGTQTRTCSLTYDCKNTDQPSKPTESRSCTPSPITKSKCAKKPDTAKGNAEPTALPEGTQREEDSPYSLWICYSQPETTDSCTAQATKRLGNTASPCVYGQESILCPQKNTVAYRDGDNLKCATIKKVEVIKETEVIRETITPPPTVVTETVRETIEVPSPISITLPTTITEESCQEYKTAIDEQVIDQGNAFIEAADKLSKSAAAQNPEFKKLFYATLKESAKKSRKLEKLVNAAACNKNTLNEVQAAAKNFKTENLEKINQGIVFIDKDVKVQNRYVGIQDNMNWLKKFAKSVKGDAHKEKVYGDDLEAFELAKGEFDELIQADAEEKVFGFEIEDIQERIEKIREKIEKDVKSEGSDKKTTLKKGSAGSKKTLKQSSKSKKKSAKKSSKKKKKSSKKKK